MKKVNLIIVILVTIISCQKEKEFNYSLVYTGEVTGINNDGAVFSAKIADLGKDNIIDYGFVWNSKSNPTIENGEKFIIGESPRTGVFSQHISTTLIANVVYHVRAFVRNQNYITYGKEVVFTSQGSSAPLIKNIFYKTGLTEDTVKIYGENFSYKNNIVRFDSIDGQVIYASQDSLMTTIPKTAYHLTTKISVTVAEKKANFESIFKDWSSNLLELSKNTETFGNQITITSNQVKFLKGSTQVLFGNIVAETKYINENQIQTIVPLNLTIRAPKLTIISNRDRVELSDKFSIPPLSLNDFSPKIAVTGSTIVLTGNNFSPIPLNNIVTVGGLKATVTKASINELRITLPLQDQGNYSARNADILVEVISEKQEYGDYLLINDKWFRLKNAPVSIDNSGYSSSYALANCFVYGTKAYIGLNNQSAFWEFNPQEDNWRRLSDFPGLPRFYGAGFVADDRIFFGTGSYFRNLTDLKDWWEYNIGTDTWSQKNNFGGTARTGAVAFQIANTGYVGTGFQWTFNGGEEYTDFWKYSPASDSWYKVTDYPMFEYFGMWWGIAVAAANEAYIGLGNVPVAGDYEKWMYKYNASTNSWQRISNFPYAGINNQSVGFNLGGTIYLKTYYNKDFYYYSGNSDSWLRLKTDILSNIDGGLGFSIGGKAYVGLGQSNALWEYDPSR